MTTWDDHYREAKAWCDTVFERWAEEQLLVAPVPSHAEIMKEGWAALREHWPRNQIDGRCILQHDLGIVPDILYEQVKYGDQWVIEAEGVIVERLPIR